MSKARRASVLRGGGPSGGDGTPAERAATLERLDRSLGRLAQRVGALREAPLPIDEEPISAALAEPEEAWLDALPADTAPSWSGEEPGILPEGATGWATEIELLYNDLLRLFTLGDTDGAIISLERLLVLSPADEQITSFLEVNEAKLTKLYEGIMGPWSNVPVRVESLGAPAFFARHQKFKAVLHLVDGRRDISAIIEESYFQKIETCALLDQLIRAKLVLAHD